MMKKSRKRLLSSLLAVALALSLLPPGTARAAQAEVTGTLSATLRIDYSQKLEELQERSLQVSVVQDGKDLGRVDLARPGTYSVGGYEAVVSARNTDGGDLGGGSWPGYLDLELRKLPRGKYTLRFTGTGYAAYSEELDMTEHAWHLIVGTGDATCTLGDVNGDGRVDVRDREELAKALGSSNSRDIAQYDLNGDNAIDIVDLAYINRLIKAEGGSSKIETTVLVPPVVPNPDDPKPDDPEPGVPGDPVVPDTDQDEPDGSNTQIEGGSLSDLFQDNGTVLRFSAPEGEDIVIPLELSEPVEMSEIQIVSPAGTGALQAGRVLVEDVDGNRMEIPFENAQPEGTHPIGRRSGDSVITISLGTRVAVKKITITVTKTEGGEYAAVETIQFLKDIVPDNPVPPNSVVKGLKAEAGNEAVSLTWDALPNVSGYKVTYWLQSSPSSTKQLQVDVPRAQVTGLDNLKTYVFTVTPTAEGWEGKPSEPVTATPQPASVPAKPDMVTVSAMDGGLSVSWKAGKSATYYEVYYQEKGAAQWQQAGGQLTQTRVTIDGLTNGVTYSVYVVAGNALGKGPKSDTAEGTPEAVKLERPEGIPTKGLLDNSLIQEVRLADMNNYDRNSYTTAKPFDVRNVIDGDYSTHWTARDWSSNEHVEVTFTQPVSLSAALWVPRLDGSYPSWLRVYSIHVWYEDDDLSKPGHLIVPDPNTGGRDDGATGNSSAMQTWPSVRGNPAVSKFAILPFDAAGPVKKISVAVEQVDYNRVSLSELLFMEYDPEHDLPGDIDKLFANSLHTELASGVTQSTIDALRTRLNGEEKDYCLYPAALEDELQLAEELLAGQSSGVLLNGLDARGGSGGSDLQPLGVTAKAGDEITIFASGIPEGKTVTVYATQFNSEVSGWKGLVGTLVNGRNIMKVPKLSSKAGVDHGGSLYFTYNDADADKISLHVRRAIDIPMLDLSDWYTVTETQRKELIGAYVDELSGYLTKYAIAKDAGDYRNVTEIATPVVLLSLPSKAVSNALGSGTREEKINTLYNNVLAWEDVMHICKTTHGIDGTYENNTQAARQNIRCMTMFEGAFMYAAGNHIGIGYGSCGGMAVGKPISTLSENAQANQLFGWGIAHEIGHNMDLLGKAEITNNIYSLMVQTYDGKQNTLPSRLEKSGKYAEIFNKVAQQYAGSSNNVFVQLGMYWQLHLAYDDGQQPMKFFNEFSKAWTAKTFSEGAGSYDEKVALTASGVTGKDLTEFFTRWGMTLSDSVKAKLASYAKEERAVWYLSDQSRRDRLNEVSPASGQLKASAEKKAGTNNEVTVSIDASGITGNVQGYEISRSGKAIAFVMAEKDSRTASYTDTIGSGNHMDYEYTVTAYDTLGNKTGSTVEAGEVRIAYDTVIDSSLYKTVPGEDGSVTITLEKETSISGLKLNGVKPESGAFTVSVTTAEDKSAVALKGDFKDNQAIDDKESFVSYFKVPEADMTDENETRIWTYDAKEVTITGLPSDVDLDKVQLISYAGDDVAFLDGATMGLLSADYKYGTEADDVIKAGTLVIVGTFRGDPVYNTFEIKGEFTGAIQSEDGDIAAAEPVTRSIDGDGYLFATVPAFGDMCDISDGLFLFVPNVQREAELQDIEATGTHCTATNLLPSRIQVNLYRTDDPDSADSKRLTAQSMWINCPGGSEEDLPLVVLEGGTQS